MMDKAVKLSGKAVTLFLLVCSVIAISVVYAGALESKVENFNKKYILTGNQSDDIASVAVAQIGKKGSSLKYTEHWCVDFVSDCARAAGIPTSVIPQCSGVSDMYNSLLANGAVRVSSPKKGDLVFYSSPGEGFTHMAIMVDTVGSVHGNVDGYGDDYTFMRTSCVRQFKYYSFRPGSPYFLRPKYSNATSWKKSASDVNIGNDFYARIINAASNKALIADDSNNVVLSEQKNAKEQIWHFTRDKDGTYTVVNCKNGKALDIYTASEASGTNVQTYAVNKGKAQRWSLYSSQGKYVFSADCTGCVMDVYKSSCANGANVIMSINNNGGSQKFIISKISAPSKPTLKISSKDKSVVFSWEKCTGAMSYTLEIRKDGKVYKTASGLTSTSSSVRLSDGSYSAVLTSENPAGSTKSGSYKFTVNNSFSDKVKITSATDAIRLKWNKVSGASGYVIYQYKSGEWKRIAKTAGAANTTYRIEKLKAGTTYKFKIQACEKSGYTILGKETNAIVAATNPEAPKITSTSRATDAVRLNWNKVPGASGYLVYQYKSGEWKSIATVKGADKLTYRASKLKSGTSYKFLVKAFRTAGDEMFTSAPSASVTVDTKLDTPFIEKLTAAKGKAIITWSDVTGAKGYEVCYSTKKDSGYQKLSLKGDVTSGAKTGLTSGKTYYFKVRAYKSQGKTNVFSGWSEIKGIKIK